MIDAVVIDPELHSSAARLLVFLIRKAGLKGEMWWKQETISAELGLSVDQIQRYLKLFHDTGRLQRIRIGLRKANHYLFPWCPLFSDGAGQPLRPSCGPQEKQPAPPEEKEPLTTVESAASVRLPETAPARLPIKRKEQGEKEEERAIRDEIGIVAALQQSPARNFRHRHPPEAIQCSPEEFEVLRGFMYQFATTDRNWRPSHTPGTFHTLPDEAITARVAAVGEWDVAAIIKHFRALKEAGKRPDSSYGWFKYMAEATYRPQREESPRPLLRDTEEAKGIEQDRHLDADSMNEWVSATQLFPEDSSTLECAGGGPARNCGTSAVLGRTAWRNLWQFARSAANERVPAPRGRLASPMEILRSIGAWD
jgi:hypothetical protein